MSAYEPIAASVAAGDPVPRWKSQVRRAVVAVMVCTLAGAACERLADDSDAGASQKASLPAFEASLQDLGWSRAQSLEGVASVVTLPGRGRRPVVVVFVAKWYAHAGPFVRDVLEDPSVRERLGGYNLVYVNVTDPSREEKQLQEVLDGQVLPSMHVFESGEKLARSLRSGESPTATATLHEVVLEAEPFLEFLEKTR